MNYPNQSIGVALLLLLFVFSISSCTTEQKIFNKVINKGIIFQGKKIRKPMVADLTYYASCIEHRECHLGEGDDLTPIVRTTLAELRKVEDYFREVLNLEDIPETCPPDAWWDWKLFDLFVDQLVSKFNTERINIYSMDNEIISQSEPPTRIRRSNYQFFRMNTVGEIPTAGDQVRLEISTIDTDTQLPEVFNYIVEIGPPLN